MRKSPCQSVLKLIFIKACFITILILSLFFFYHWKIFLKIPRFKKEKNVHFPLEFIKFSTETYCSLPLYFYNKHVTSIKIYILTTDHSFNEKIFTKELSKKLSLIFEQTWKSLTKGCIFSRFCFMEDENVKSLQYFNFICVLCK